MHYTKEQIYFYERPTKERQTIRQMSGCLNHSNERIIQVFLQMQGQIKDSWKWGPYV